MSGRPTTATVRFAFLAILIRDGEVLTVVCTVQHPVAGGCRTGSRLKEARQQQICRESWDRGDGAGAEWESR